MSSPRAEAWWVATTERIFSLATPHLWASLSAEAHRALCRGLFQWAFFGLIGFMCLCSMVLLISFLLLSFCTFLKPWDSLFGMEWNGRVGIKYLTPTTRGAAGQEGPSLPRGFPLVLLGASGPVMLC